MTNVPHRKAYRPGKPTTSLDGEPRLSRIIVRVSGAEYAYVQQLATAHGTDLSALVRSCLLVDMPNTREDR